MYDCTISLMENTDIQESAKVLSLAMLNNPLHLAVFQGNSEHERVAIEHMFSELFLTLPGIVFLAKDHHKIVGVMRMKSCIGREVLDESHEVKDENTLSWRKSLWQKEWATYDLLEQHWHLGPLGVLPSHRGMGIGSRLMQRFCKEVDACSAKAYLETDVDENVRFYKKFGFEIIATSILFDVENRYMERVSQTCVDGMHNVLRLRVSRCGVKRLTSTPNVSGAGRFGGARSRAETQVLVELAPCG